MPITVCGAYLLPCSRYHYDKYVCKNNQSLIQCISLMGKLEKLKIVDYLGEHIIFFFFFQTIFNPRLQLF